MQQKTAVGWLIDQFEKHENGQIDWMSRSATKSQALQMEKEHLMMAFNDGKVNSVLKKRNSEEYYNETYNNKNK